MMRNFLLTAAVFLGICLVYILIMLSTTENYFTYLLDDAYIHLSIAKNFSTYGVWGVTQYAFSSSSSSPVFTLILSFLISVFGNQLLIPLIFNIVAAGFLIFLLNRYYAQFFRNRQVVIASLFTLFLAVLHVQVMTGMEHVLHALMIAVNIYYFQKWAESDFKNRTCSYGFYITISLLGLIRFESMFYFAALAFVFVLVKNFKNAVLVLLAGFIPVFVFSYFNCSKTGYFFPNSVILKGPLLDFSGNIGKQLIDILFERIFLNLSFYKIGLFPLLISVVLVVKEYKKKLGLQKIILNNFLVIAWSLALLMHSVSGRLTGIFRYEAYLLIAFSMVLIPKLKPFLIQPFSAFKRDKITGLFVFANIVLLAYKLGYAHFIITCGSANVYEQQIQSARFLKEYYNDSKVVANDIGAISYFTDIHLLDFMGLGSDEIVHFRANTKKLDDHFYGFLSQYSRENKYKLAIAYEEWLDWQTPKNWRKVAYLEVSGRNLVLGEKHLFIYSIDPEIHDSLKQNIKAFKWNKNVKVTLLE
ncbi:hypothetical protein ABXT08_02890 [Chryseobacterium sp. NRRL B-14859]|uniref:hypothetical protein n=1 Tax=Chryseobacterium sp. NRRL B-14859 TaxID=1562763 RepID=UPI003393E597